MILFFILGIYDADDDNDDDWKSSQNEKKGQIYSQSNNFCCSIFSPLYLLSLAVDNPIRILIIFKMKYLHVKRDENVPCFWIFINYEEDDDSDDGCCIRVKWKLCERIYVWIIWFVNVFFFGCFTK